MLFMKELLNRIAASSTGGDNPLTLEESLRSYSSMGYKKFELYMQGRGASPDLAKGADYVLEVASRYGMTYSSLHLVAVEADFGETLQSAVADTLFAEKLGIPVVVFNATEKSHYAAAMKKFLEAIGDSPVTPVVQIHEGRALDTLEDVIEVLEQINDERVKVLHEVGTYHNRGQSWKKICDVFGSRIGLVHVKDMIGGQSMPFGTGEIDLPALFKEMEEKLGYKGDYVIEIDPPNRSNTNQYIAQAFEYIKEHC